MKAGKKASVKPYHDLLRNFTKRNNLLEYFLGKAYSKYLSLLVTLHTHRGSYVSIRTKVKQKTVNRKRIKGKKIGQYFCI